MDYWQQHGWLFLFGCAFFPRVTTLFFSAVSFGFWHILGWLFAPHLLVRGVQSASSVVGLSPSQSFFRLHGRQLFK